MPKLVAKKTVLLARAKADMPHDPNALKSKDFLCRLHKKKCDAAHQKLVNTKEQLADILYELGFPQDRHPLQPEASIHFSMVTVH